MDRDFRQNGHSVTLVPKRWEGRQPRGERLWRPREWLVRVPSEGDSARLKAKKKKKSLLGHRDVYESVIDSFSR